MKFSELKVGTLLSPDGGFDCMEKGDIKTVLKDDGGLYVECELTRHYLCGDVDGDGNLIHFLVVEGK